MTYGESEEYIELREDNADLKSRIKSIRSIVIAIKNSSKLELHVYEMIEAIFDITWSR